MFQAATMGVMIALLGMLAALLRWAVDGYTVCRRHSGLCRTLSNCQFGGRSRLIKAIASFIHTGGLYGHH